MASDKGRGKAAAAPVSLLESVSAAIGLALVVAMLAFLAYGAARSRNDTPPIMRVEPVGLTAAGGQYIVEVELSNRSRSTGASVGVEGVLKRGGREVETSSATFAYVPGKSRRRGGLIFTGDPRSHVLELRVTGYERP